MKFWLATFLLVLPLWVRAQTGGGTAAKVSTGRFEVYMNAGYLGISSASTQIDLAPGFQYVPLPKFGWLQIGGEIVFQHLKFRDAGTINKIFLAGITGNMGPTLNEAFFVSLGASMRSGSTDLPDATSADPNGFGYYFIAGKRFPIAGGFSLRPSMGVIVTGTSGMVFRPFAVSFHF